MTPFGRHVAVVIREQVRESGEWSPVRFRKAARIRRNAWKARKPYRVEEVVRAARLLRCPPSVLLLRVEQDAPPADGRGASR